ncbi:MAG: B12-binding domain-containing protein [Gemmataceae bacterium]|nr:B12-binding domain-containing protein [Gemmataceae bacterium]
MNDSRYVSTAQVAEVLGVGVTTVKRWVDEGILPAHRTAGGHRKLLLADVLRLARQSNFPNQNLGPLFAAGHALVPAHVQDLEQALFVALERGDGDLVRSLIQGAYRRGVPVDDLADGVIAPAMQRIGHDWETGKIDVFHEHRGSQLCVAALHELIGLVSSSAAGRRPLALGGAPEKDPYVLTSLLAELVLRQDGWQVVNLGPNTPLASLRKAVNELKPRLLWLTVSYLEDADTFLTEYRQLYQESDRLGVPVAVGGRALTDSLRARMPYTTYGDGMAHLSAFARTLSPGKRRPPRGRPTKQSNG